MAHNKMTKQTERGAGFSPKRIEEVARTHDAIQRARAATPVTKASDRLSGLKSFINRDRA